MATVEFERARMCTVQTESDEHLFGKLGQEGWIVLPIDHKGLLTSAHTLLNIRHRTDWGPIFPQFVNRHMPTQAFPNVIGGHALTNHVGKVGGHMEESARAQRLIMNQSN